MPDPGAHGEPADRPLISVIVPAYNEEESVIEFQKRLSAVFEKLAYELEVIYVNDGSQDRTFDTLYDMHSRDWRIKIIDLSRNFGKEIAMTAGLDLAKGDAVIIIDVDLQDPPELIPELLKEWRSGYDVVYAKRTQREGETVLKKTSAHVFYRIIQKVSRVRIPEDTGDFRLLSKRAVESLRLLREQHRFMKGLFAWIGYPQIAVPYQRQPRHAGNTKWNYWKLWNFALDGITSFTNVPLKISTYIGVLTALVGFCYSIFIVTKAIFWGDPVRGFPSIIMIVTLLGGVQLIFLGIIGEYLGRMFDETKRRPLYLIKNIVDKK
jgi:glycosyltransferase involved in cell wall biosynthesis